MPFTLDGNWIPPKKHYPPIHIIKEKRKGKMVTLIKNIPLEGNALKDFVSELKKHLAVGGSLKQDILEIQGDKSNEIQDFLKMKGLKYHCK
jgi:translation initiation factor 1